MTIARAEYASIKEKSVQGRYIVTEQIFRFLKKGKAKGVVNTIGTSVQNRAIPSIVFGTGPKKVMMWSQMHGNESTTTKSVLDMINYFDSRSEVAQFILKSCTIAIIPMLNPDGAAAYTRVNANKVDLNRDAQERTQPESKALRKLYDEFSPDYCFNLHDQRTIFNVGNTSKSATVSFLAPAYDEERNISAAREKSMQLIVAMNAVLQKLIPGHVGRYDDAFNANCVGDTFQMLDTPTVLFEAGHCPSDYQREKTREYIFHALITSLHTIATDAIQIYDSAAYFEIPENKKCFFDILVKNIDIIDPTFKNGDAVGILYEEVLRNGGIDFKPKIDKSGNLEHYFGHETYDCASDNDLALVKKRAFFEDILNYFR